MNNSSTSVESLFNLTLNKLWHSMSEDILQKLLKDYPTSIIFKVIWKILRINNGNEDFVFSRNIQYTESSAFNNDATLAHMMSNDYYLDYFRKINLMVDTASCPQQLVFCDNFKFCNYFDLELFFKLVENSYYRCKLFVIFQICVLKRGIEFPKQFATIWIESNTQEDEINFHHIERGLLLGTFLGDCGWFNESALVLSYTYKIISTKWVYSDQNLKVEQSIQCLTKWLLVVTVYHDFDDAKVILPRILNNIEHLKQTEGKHLYIINACIAVSEYYHVIMEYDKAWLWACKAVNKLHNGSSSVLRLLVMSHCVKISSVTNRLSIAKNIIQELYTYNKEIDTNIWIDVIMNIAYYSLHANLAKFYIPSYFTALNSSLYLFGYNNLRTANIFIEYAYARFGANYSETNFTKALSSVNQGICIMYEIKLPNNNMLLINAQVIKSFILQQLFIIRIPPPQFIESVIPTLEILRINMEDTESCHFKAIEVSSKSFGEKAPITARSYYNLGRLYQNQQKLLDFKLMQFTLLAIEGSVEHLEKPGVQLCQRYLSNMYKTQREKVDKAEQLYLQAKLIYETTYGPEYFWLLNVYQRLSEVYDTQKDSPKYITCIEKMWLFQVKMKKTLSHQMPIINENCMKGHINLEQLKCIINNCE